MGERWEIPGGKLEPGEDFRKAIIREFQEEFYLEPMIGPFLVSADFINNGKRYRVDAYQIMLEMLPEQTPEHSEIKIVNLQKTLTLPLVDSDRSLIQTLFKNRPQIKSMFTQT
jgi:8-oxo-dGTP diphosphatase